MELDDIGAASETEAAAGERKAANCAKIMPPRLPGKIGLFVEKPTLRGQAVLCPSLLKVDQRPLTRTEGKMLQPAQWQSIIWRFYIRNGWDRHAMGNRLDPFFNRNAIGWLAFEFNRVVCFHSRRPILGNDLWAKLRFHHRKEPVCACVAGFLFVAKGKAPDW